MRALDIQKETEEQIEALKTVRMDLHRAQVRFTAAQKQANDAQLELTSARNELNNHQKAFDALVEDVRGNPEPQSLWGEVTRARAR